MFDCGVEVCALLAGLALFVEGGVVMWPHFAHLYGQTGRWAICDASLSTTASAIVEMLTFEITSPGFGYAPPCSSSSACCVASTMSANSCDAKNSCLHVGWLIMKCERGTQMSGVRVGGMWRFMMDASKA